jgi:hypothetical protein
MDKTQVVSVTRLNFFLEFIKPAAELVFSNKAAVSTSIILQGLFGKAIPRGHSHISQACEELVCP